MKTKLTQIAYSFDDNSITTILVVVLSLSYSLSSLTVVKRPIISKQNHKTKQNHKQIQ